MSKSIGIMTGNGDHESMEVAQNVLEAVGDFEFREVLIGVAAIEDCGDPTPLVTRRVARASHAVLLGPAVPDGWEASTNRGAPDPRTAPQTLRKTLDVLAYIQPITGAEGWSPVIVHALDDIRRESVGRTAFELARTRAAELKRPARVTNVTSDTVTKASRAWRETVSVLQNEEYTDVSLDHMPAGRAQMRIAADPQRFDIIVTGKRLGNVLSTTARTTDPSLIPSGWINEHGHGIFGSAMYEGRGRPIPSILSAAMALRHSLDMPDAAADVEHALSETLEGGIRTPDLGGDASVRELTDAVIDNLRS